MSDTAHRYMTDVWILTQLNGDDSEIVGVFATEEAATGRIISWVKGEELFRLSGLSLTRHPVMDS